MPARDFQPTHTADGPLSCRQLGMTLIEVLVAISLLAILASLAYRGLDQLQRQSTQLLDDSRRWQDLAASFQRLETDLAQAVYRPVRPAVKAEAGLSSASSAITQIVSSLDDSAFRPALLGLPAAMSETDSPVSAFVTQTADSSPTLAYLEFTRKSPSGQDELRLAYRLHGHTLELLLWPALDPAAITDQSQSGQPEIYPLLEKVRTLEFRYLDDDGLWQTRWPVTSASTMDSAASTAKKPQARRLPRAVELRLELIHGKPLRRVFALPALAA